MPLPAAQRCSDPNTALKPAATNHLLEEDYDIRTIQNLLGHKDVSTTMILPMVSIRVATG
jgi:site-specific recombinase XerD